MKKALAYSLITSSILCAVSCNTTTDQPRLANGGLSDAGSSMANNYFAQAKKQEAAGKTSAAIKSYKELTEKYPLAPQAAQARYQQATLLYRKGDLIKSFDAYQSFIEKYNSSNLYSQALARQQEVATAAAGGKIKNNFLGLKSNIGATTAAKMLTQVKNNAPYAKSAPQAQFSIGELWQSRKENIKAIAAYKQVQRDYPNSKLTPEALYRVGTLLMNESKSGNPNKSSLDQARSVLLDLRQQYPNSPRAKDAKVKLRELASANVQRSYDIAEFYRKKGQNNAAIIYYKEVIKLSPSGSLHNLAKQRLATLGQ